MITRYLYRNPRVVWLIALTIIVAGITCLWVMPRLEDPVLGRRVGVISTQLRGANPGQVESTVTIPVEQWLSEFSEIKQIRSNTRANISNVVIELEDRVSDTAAVWSAIKSKLSDNAHLLPDESSAPELTVFPLKAFAAILAIVPAADRPPDPFLQRRLAQELRKTILGLEGTENVSVFGDPGEELTVLTTPESLAATGLSIGSLAQTIANSKSVPAGSTEQAGMQLMVDVGESNELARRIENIFVRGPTSGKSVRLSEIATVAKGLPSPSKSEANIDGKQAIVLGVMVDNDFRVDLWNQQLNQVASEFREEFAGEFEVDSLFQQSDHIQLRMDSLLNNLGVAAAAVILIAFLLMGWRCMIVVAISLPLSACLVIFGLRLLSIPIHQISVTGLIVALGLLIDNSIVMVEEVRSRIFSGLRPLAAMLDAVRHLTMPLFGSTLTTILAFVPIATMPGPAGEFVGSIAVSVILAISASFLLAITIVPPLVFMLGVNSNRQGVLNYGLRFWPLESMYRLTLEKTFQFPILGVMLGIGLPLAGFYSAQYLDKEFFPASDRNQIQIELELPASATLDVVRESVDQVRTIVMANSDVSRQHWFLGESAPTFYYNVVPRRQNSPSYAQAFIDIRANTDIDALVSKLQSDIDAQIFDARIIVRKLEQGPPFDAPIELRIFGNDLAQLQQSGDEIRAILASSPLVTHTRSDLADTLPKLTLKVDPTQLRDDSLTRNDISKFLYSSLEGASAGSFFDNGEQIPVRVRCDYAGRSVIESLHAMKIGPAREPATGPEQFPTAQRPGQQPTNRRPAAPLLASLGKFELDSDVGAIIRIDGLRVNEVKAYLRTGVSASEATDELIQVLADSGFSLPQSYRLEVGGEEEKRSQAISTLMANAVVLFAVMLLTLVAVFGSFRSALLIAGVGGLAIGLGPMALYGFGFPLGFMAIVGTMGLVGVAINDSIVVLAAIRANDEPEQASSDLREVDHSPNPNSSDHETDERKELTDVVFGCTRHVLTTTFTTMIGFLPLVMNGGKFWPPLAIVMSAGVAGATLIALYFVPSVYLLIYPKRR